MAGPGRGAAALPGTAPAIHFSESAWPPAPGFNKIPTALQRSSPNLVLIVQYATRVQQETKMNPTIMSDIAKHRIADWHRQADRDRTARAARATRNKHASHRLSVTAAGLAAALALLAYQGTATAASHRPHHHAAHAAVRQTQNSLTFTDLKDLANVKRDLQAMVQQMQGGMTVEGRQDLANIKRGLFRS
jgi:hypothetical protein